MLEVRAISFRRSELREAVQHGAACGPTGIHSLIDGFLA
jgi:hypothetical protein